MKFAGLCLLAILFAPISVQAEMIEPISMTTEFGAAGTTAQVYVKVVFLKRNSGTPITGLTTTNIRPFLMTEKTLNPSSYAWTTTPYNMSYTLVPSTDPYKPGLYTLILKPIGGKVWGPSTSIYTVRALVKGTSPADYGTIEIVLASGG